MKKLINLMSGSLFMGISGSCNHDGTLVIMSPKDKITVSDLNNMKFDEEKINSEIEFRSIDTETASLEEMLNNYEKQILKKFKEKYKTTYRIAKELNVNQSTISRKLTKYRL